MDGVCITVCLCIRLNRETHWVSPLRSRVELNRHFFYVTSDFLRSEFNALCQFKGRCGGSTEVYAEKTVFMKDLCGRLFVNRT